MLNRKLSRGISAAVATGAISALAAVPAISHHSSTTTGPSTNTKPYVLPVSPGVTTKSIFTVGDDKAAGNGYEMTGIPDGLGAFGGGNTFTLLMNHELRPDVGAVRAHGQKGAFVSKLTIDRRTLRVKRGEDFIKAPVEYWDYVTQTYQPVPSTGGVNPRTPTDLFLPQLAAFSRFCSGFLSAPGQLYYKGGRGYTGQIYFANEEAGDEGRVFGVTDDGHAQQLQRLGLFSWENTIVAPGEDATTLVMGNEDNAAGQMWAYIGTKARRGDAFDKAGLTNGHNTVMDLLDETVATDAQFRTKYGKDNPVEFDLAEVEWDQSGKRQNEEAAADGLTLNRIEDGAFDPKDPNSYYFVTTEGGDTTPSPFAETRNGGGLWRMTFEDVEEPELGGTLELLLDGTEAPYLNKPDNMDIDRRGHLLIQEDPGGNDQLARIVAYNIPDGEIADGEIAVLAQFDPLKFAPGATAPESTTDEESSGIIDASRILGRNWFLFDAQVHKAHPKPEYVEYGQLLAMKVDWDEVFD